ncbi:Uu.00g107380.m01.CDS01 [Anthostomella pinea]|uniref:Uu.00g107380.m01.CDS01 n=1 Tax=Anthostomella pinea TaxID=933095 RepID=A0AAI8YFZ9_9PEZI|nr:Uu.00g107380.m01.CDS01 [Anthostomella pinea]
MAGPNDSQAVGIKELGIINQCVNYEPTALPGQEWRGYPEIPTARDLNPDLTDPKQLAEVQSLLPNNWREPWSEKDKYLETHYRLQREEAITMLRYSIKKYQETPRMMDDEETCIYTKVFVKGYLMTRLGPMCRVQFSTERSGKKIRWTQTRRLTTGSLVALSTAEDGFKTICLPAVIADHPIRDGLDQNPPTIQIHWARSEDAIVDPTAELVIIEARTGYFEAVRHSMVGLQHVAMTDTPIDKYLVGADKGDYAAQYVQQSPEMNIRSLVHHVPNSAGMSKAAVRQKITEAKEPLANANVIRGLNDNLSPYTNLDNSQLSAVHRILTRELAIVQGPPGTGKTFTSVQALRILLETQERGSNVIIVAAQTNHAVDQILIQLVKLGFDAVRLGGRSQNEEIKRYSMYNLRRQKLASFRQRADGDYKTCESARKKNISNLECMVNDVFPGGLVDPANLLDAGIITVQQMESLGYDDDQWAAEPLQDRPAGSLSEWLGDDMVEAPPMAFKDPVFETPENDDAVDLDAEDYDLELDDCIVDDDDDRGRVDGKWIPIRHRWIGANPHGYSGTELVIRRERAKPNLWDIEQEHRGTVYEYWQRQLLRVRAEEFREALADNTRICKSLKINRWYKDTQYIKSSKIEIIGCTTTGLCKYRGFLSALQPRTMLIEEAAETREANIMSALYGSLQQLILVGDHQQLAPHCDTPRLADEPYCMRVSMFERLVKLNMPFTVLNMQRRMIPILREVLNPFYPMLQDHPVVTKKDARPPVPGMSVESYFFHHTWTEDTDENLSKFNLLEADMVVRFIDYLLMNGVDAAQITVLTFYRGQRKQIISEARKQLSHWAPFNNVQTVDSYQGEENDIVILSLVRSNGPNGPHRPGFLRDCNRGVVSISRARRGFYIFGNMTNLTEGGEESRYMWGNVEKVFKLQKRFGDSETGLPITCQRHGTTSRIRHPEDWMLHHGGCKLPCPDKLSCGHPCGRRCHWVDHNRLICLQPCEKTLRCGHRCQEVCGEGCVCNCSDFTGAYAHDEDWDADTALDDQEMGVEFNPGLGAASFGQGGQRTTRRGDQHGNYRYGSRGRRGGLGYNGGRAQAPNLSDTTGHGTEARSGNAQHLPWGAFDARQDDARRRGAHGPSLVVDAPHASGSSRMPRYKETWRHVTLSNGGKRNVGRGNVIVSGSSGTPSPEKDDPHLSAKPTSRGEAPVTDLLSFNDTVRTEALVLPLRLHEINQSKVSTNTFINPDRSDAEVVASTPARQAQRSFKAPGAFQYDGQPNDGDLAGSSAASLRFSGRNDFADQGPQFLQRIRPLVNPTTDAGRQLDKPEWEVASTVVDESNNGDADDVDDKEEEDLIHF